MATPSESQPSATPTPNPDTNLGLDYTTLTLSSGTIAHSWTRHSHPIAIIILQHGYAEYATRYLTSHHNLITHLVSANYAVYAMDIWGHGSSPGTRAVAHVSKAVSDHIELRQRALAIGVPVILFGHSLGGLVTAGSVTRDAGRVAGVVLTGPALPGPYPYIARVAVGVAARSMPTVTVPGQQVDISGLTRVQRELDKYLADTMYLKKGICFLVAATAVDVADEVRNAMGEWEVPTLVLHGNEDPYCDYRASETFVDKIKSEDKEFAVYDGGRHELLHDEVGDLVLERVMGWIGAHAM